MKIVKKINNYFLQTSEDYFQDNLEKRNKFLDKKKNFFYEISSFINSCINSPSKILFFCCGNSLISEKVSSKKKYIHEINDGYLKRNLKNKLSLNKRMINSVDHIIIADTEHQKNLVSNLDFISTNMNDSARVILVSKSLVWMFFINLYRKILFLKNNNRSNFLPFGYLKQLFKSQGFDLVRNEKIIFFPFNFPILNDILNTLFRLPILNFFCLMNITVFKKKNVQKKINKISFIIPCKNEEENVLLFKKKILSIRSNRKIEFIFGNDKSNDNTKKNINLLKKEIKNKHNIIEYEGPGICKSKNVYKGIELASGDVIVIYDADLTVKFNEIMNCINLLCKSNIDFINCTRMIYPQKNNAMKTLNFFGNIFFAKLFSILFKQKITDTLCGTKIFFKDDWIKIKKYNSTWGVIDKWGDFDLLIGAYQNNLKISEIPVHYQERVSGVTKMNSLFFNTIRMLLIVLFAYYKLKIKK
tara:strand:+ start:151 stop:1566 length:1416 start_codon:yes stop_codon:yes gene_type:complete